MNCVVVVPLLEKHMYILTWVCSHTINFACSNERNSYLTLLVVEGEGVLSSLVKMPLKEKQKCEFIKENYIHILRF